MAEESFIKDLTEKLEAWKALVGPSEAADQFARRIVGLMRTEEKKWGERKK